MKNNLFKKLLFLTLCLLIQSCPKVEPNPLNGAINSAEIFAFFGEQSVGKTTIMDSLIGKKVSKTNNMYLHDKIFFLKTSPIRSFADPWDVKVASFLGLKRKYYLFFVIQLNNGQLKKEDLAEINTILDGINSTNKEFNIIINKLITKEAKFFKNNKLELAKLFKKINAGKYKTKNIYFLKKDHDLKDGNKDFLTLNQSFKDFIYNKSLATVINKEEIPDIKYSVYKQYEKDISDEFDLINDSIEPFLNLDAEAQIIVNELENQL